MTTYKQPAEKKPFTWDFTNLLPTGETLQGTSDVKIFDGSGTDVTSSMLVSKTISSPKLTAVVQGGTNLSDYKMTFIGRTQTYTFEEDLTLKVRER